MVNQIERWSAVLEEKKRGKYEFARGPKRD
jgi:hypothetical protein